MSTTTNTNVATATKRKSSCSAEAPATSRKKRSRATIHHLVSDGQPVFSLSKHTQDGAPIKSKMATIVPITYPGSRPVLIQLSGGGRIPSFGVDQNEDKPSKFNIVFNVESEEEFESMQNMRNELIQLAMSKWSSWFPDQKKPSDELIKEQCNPLVSKRTPKQNSPNEFWPGTLKTVVEMSDIQTEKCRFRDRDTGDKLELADLAGMNWHKAVVELRSVYVLSNRSYGISKRLRYLECSEGPLAEEIIPL
jgi:hypothetical protein